MSPLPRVIYNQDCTNLFVTEKEPLAPRHVDRMVDEVAEGGADLFLVNPNAQLDIRGGGDLAGRQAPALARVFDHLIENLKRSRNMRCVRRDRVKESARIPAPPFHRRSQPANLIQLQIGSEADHFLGRSFTAVNQHARP